MASRFHYSPGDGLISQEDPLFWKGHLPLLPSASGNPVQYLYSLHEHLIGCGKGYPEVSISLRKDTARHPAAKPSLHPVIA